jgi:RNA polymerase sigma-70 factor (ECF subfamily)
MLGLYVEERMPTAATSKMTTRHSTETIENIFHEHYQLVYQTACVVTGSPEDADDVLQTIFLRLLGGNMPRFQDAKAYFYRAAVNVSLNVVRARQRHVLIADSDFFESPQRAENSSVDDEMRTRLVEMIATLSPRTVEILILRYVHDYTEPEIAKLLGRSRGTIAVTLFRARSHLRKLLRSLAGDKR